ncbi:nucleotidyltransferase domain-containing protein [Persephonella sp. IF05-L8]|uniref:nucleotidyltransferase domain-containing protein n=1 Tax=Persephonella sp. IF05-L8 TaxID=1158338 RepID=UPI000496054D
MEKIRNLSYKDEKIARLLEEIVNILRKNIKIPFRLCLFGSFATGKASYFSDLDIALETEKEITEKILNLIKKSKYPYIR